MDVEQGAPGPHEADRAPSPHCRILSRLAASASPPNPALRGYVLATFVTSTGTGMYMTVAVVYFVRSLSLSAGFVGLGLTIATGLGVAVSLPAGRLADRHRAKPVLIVLFIIQAMLFALFPLVSGPVEFFVAAVLVSMAASATVPVNQVLLSDLVAGGPRVAAAAYNRSVLNVGMSVGTLVAAWAFAANSRSAYHTMLIGNAVSFVGAAAVLSRVKVPARVPRASVPGQTAATGPRRHPLRQPMFVVASAICGVLFLSASILDVALPLQVSQHTVAPRWMIAALLLLNTVLVVTLQVRASAGSETIPGASRANRLAGIALVGACVLFAATTTHSAVVAALVLVGATVLLTAGELFSSAGAWGLSYGLAPADQQGKYLASFNLLTRMVGILGPGLAVAVVNVGLAGWLAVGVVFLGTGLAAPFVTRSGQEPVNDPVS